MTHQEDQEDQENSRLKDRFLQLLGEYEDNRLVSMLVELFEEGLLDFTCEMESQPVLLVKASIDHFDIHEITDPLEINVARGFRAGKIIFVVREGGRPPIEWRVSNELLFRSFVN